MAVAVFTDHQFVAMSLVPLPDPIMKNGSSWSLSDFIDSALLTASTKEGALGMIYEFLTSEDFLNSEKLDQYEYQKRKQTYFDLMIYWQGQDRANMFGQTGGVPGQGQTGCAPSVQPGGILGLPWWPLPPAVR